MPPLTRRDAVRAGALALAGLAGCTTGGGSPTDGTEEPRLDRVRVGNWRSEDVSLDLQLEFDGEVVFWRDVSVPGVSGSDSDSVHGEAFTPPAFPRERGEWRVRARVRNTDRTYAAVFNSETTAESCLDLGVNVRGEEVDITYVATHDCDTASTTTE